MMMMMTFSWQEASEQQDLSQTTFPSTSLKAFTRQPLLFPSSQADLVMMRGVSDSDEGGVNEEEEKGHEKGAFIIKVWDTEYRRNKKAKHTRGGWKDVIANFGIKSSPAMQIAESFPKSLVSPVQV